MIATDEDSLICDFAETYGIFNYRGLPAKLAAVLACGLRDDSRIVEKMTGTTVKVDTFLLASAVDILRVLAWQNTADGQKGRNIPESIAKSFMAEEDKRNTEFEIYACGEDFDSAWKDIIGD